MSARFDQVLTYLEHRHGGPLRESTPRRLLHAQIHRDLVRQTRLPLVLVHLVAQCLGGAADSRGRLIVCGDIGGDNGVDVDGGGADDSKMPSQVARGNMRAASDATPATGLSRHDRTVFEARLTRHIETRAPDWKDCRPLAYGDRLLVGISRFDSQQQQQRRHTTSRVAIWNGCSATLVRGTDATAVSTVTTDGAIDDTWRLDFPSGHWFGLGWQPASRAETVESRVAAISAELDPCISLLSSASPSLQSSTPSTPPPTTPRMSASRIEKARRSKETPSGFVLVLGHAGAQSFVIDPHRHEFRCEPVDVSALLSAAAASREASLPTATLAAESPISWRLWRLTRPADDACSEVDPNDEVVHVFALRGARLDAAPLRVLPCLVYRHAAAVLGASVACFPIVAATHNLNPHRTFFQDTETSATTAAVAAVDIRL